MSLLRYGHKPVALIFRLSQNISSLTITNRLYSSENNSTLNEEEISRGKKIKPTKPNIVVLDLKQSGLVPLRKHKDYRNSISSQNHISFLQGIDFDDSGKQFSEINKPLQENNNDEELNLLKFSSKATKDQVVQSIDSLKPPTIKISPKVFEDLINKLVDRYTVKQLRYYIGTKNPTITRSKIVKLKLANKVVKDIWNIDISNTMTNVTYSTRTINLNDTQTKLLLLTQNGKILKNLSRLDKNLLIQLDLLNNQLKLWGNDSILKYIEISINKVLKNISVTSWFDDITETSDNNKIISRITRLCGVDINLNKNEIAAFGWKRIQLAKRLLLWSNYYDKENDLNSPFFKQNIDKIENELSNNSWFPFTEIQNLNWLKRIESLEYLRKMSPINDCSSNDLSTQTNIVNKITTTNKLDDIYNFFVNTSSDSTQSNVLSISLGQILKSKQSPINNSNDDKLKSLSKWVFQSRVPQLSQKLLKLPLFNEVNEEDELLSLDQHDYYLQLILTPTKQSITSSASSNSTFPNSQPLELWLQLDENEQIIMDSVQAIIPTLRENYLIQTPDLPYDYRISNDHVMSIPVTLETQPQLISYLNDVHTGNNIDNFKIPSELTINTPSENLKSMKYNYVTCNRHKILKLKYMDKYCVQYSEIDGGELGEKSQQIDFICNDSTPTKEEFKKFLNDVFKF